MSKPYRPRCVASSSALRCNGAYVGHNPCVSTDTNEAGDPGQAAADHQFASAQEIAARCTNEPTPARLSDGPMLRDPRAIRAQRKRTPSMTRPMNPTCDPSRRANRPHRPILAFLYHVAARRGRSAWLARAGSRRRTKKPHRYANALHAKPLACTVPGASCKHRPERRHRIMQRPPNTCRQTMPGVHGRGLCMSPPLASRACRETEYEWHTDQGARCMSLSHLCHS